MEAVSLATRLSRVVVAHNPVAAGDDPSTADVLAQVELVHEGLAALGLAASTVAVPGARPWEVIRPEPGLAVVNLVESPPGLPWLQPANAAALAAMGLPFTGSTAGVLWLTTDKLSTRALLAAEGLAVAPGGRLDPADPRLLDRVPPPWILKPAREDASLGIEGDPLCRTREQALARAADLAGHFPGQPVLAERYLPGREFNVALLARPEGGAEVLPVAEMEFVDFPEGMPRVLSYEAKWLDDSFEATHTVRRFPAEDGEDAPLLARVAALALAAWEVCELEGYARVDIRLNEAGEPSVLEVNANPCLAADAGFMAAAGRAGLGAAAVVARLLDAALRSGGRA